MTKYHLFVGVGIATHATHFNKLVILSGVTLYNGDVYTTDRMVTLPLLSSAM